MSLGPLLGVLACSLQPIVDQKQSKRGNSGDLQLKKSIWWIPTMYEKQRGILDILRKDSMD